jgi:hypothetical protein
MTKLMERVIDHLRQIPEAEQDQVAGEVKELLEDFPTQQRSERVTDRSLHTALKEGAIARASRDCAEAALFDFTDLWETIRD